MLTKILHQLITLPEISVSKFEIVLEFSLIAFFNPQQKLFFILRRHTRVAGEISIGRDKRNRRPCQQVSSAVTTVIGIRHNPHVENKLN